ncbi:bifunctional phosphopantothenoylcysteine decarboxylase/phosphopantothenate synthase [Chitinophaga filiformis]|uniref:bifunctional phosphopantothenoylcysteine decarboxylase/phosphopantothenate synthase n=1 Tax=Chitinophaga filiformis TaxID=104663 RepID=UPI001F2000B9|nr:bifunctional phosphopantothenoylcysteine decarboxylase/phosphopantothenate synthase [Chitinophaga filiformis]MCF6403948.1 bifunctional phosphopantothenoylcysteine decarboxylase/phosphopantothenate synthase [Chitinophaga filiformis]
MLQGKKILLGVSGSIAAYKAATLVRLLVKEGADVKVVMTPSACDFITPLTLATLSKHEVPVTISDNQSWNNHVMLGRWADVMLIAPASANTLSKMANGACDNLLMATYLSATCPVLFAPAMDEDMWHHPATRNNISKLLSYGHQQIPVEKGELASGLFGEGRMAEPENIVKYLEGHFSNRQYSNKPEANPDAAGSTGQSVFTGQSGAGAAQHIEQQQFVSAGLPLRGKKALVTAGPTQEPLDPVRYISNHSSGKMGIAIADALAAAGAEVTLVLGPTGLSAVHPAVNTIRVVTAEDMFNGSAAHFAQADVIVMAAAVADYRPKHVADIKMKKGEGDALTLELEKTKDILRTLGATRTDKQVLVGFSLETNNEKEYALKKLREKHLDLVVMNSLNDKGAGFNHDTNKVTLFDKKGDARDLPLKSKVEVAQDIVAAIVDIVHLNSAPLVV